MGCSHHNRRDPFIGKDFDPGFRRDFDHGFRRDFDRDFDRGFRRERRREFEELEPFPFGRRRERFIGPEFRRLPREDGYGPRRFR